MTGIESASSPGCGNALFIEFKPGHFSADIIRLSFVGTFFPFSILAHLKDETVTANYA